jgi:hypothetical protein
MPTPATNSTPQPKPESALLTRHEAAEFIRHELGRPMSFSTLTKLCALGEGPPPADTWGKRPLYSRDGLREWAENRGQRPVGRPANKPQPTPRKLIPDKPTGKPGRRRVEASAGA